MKKVVLSLITAGILTLVTGCATYIPAGGIFVDGKTGVAANPNVEAKKNGKACMNSVLGLVAFGDASVEMAKRNGNIKNIATMNYSAHNILGIYGTYCLEISGN